MVLAFFVTGGLIAAAAGAVLIATVFAAVYHAEVVAHRIGEPFGTLVLAVAVTVIEVALIVSVMVAAPADKAGLARDTVFAAVMIVCNGIVGLCLLWGGARHHEQGFHVHGASAALAVLAALTILTLVLPNVATTAPGPYFSTPQLVFAGMISLVLYGSFVFVQTVRHRDYFLPFADDARKRTPRRPRTGPRWSASACCSSRSSPSSASPSRSRPRWSSGSPASMRQRPWSASSLRRWCCCPKAWRRSARRALNRLQTSLNLALGSALASIGLTIPAVAVVSIVLSQPIELGLGDKDQVLLALTLLVGVITLGTGRTTVLQGIVHLVIFAVFLFFAVIP